MNGRYYPNNWRKSLDKISTVDTLDYIKSFLLYDNEEAADFIGYTADEQEWHRYRLVVVPTSNPLNGGKWYIPDLSKPAHAEKIGEIVDEFGEKTGGTWIIREDIIYHTLFLLSRAEERLNAERDEHGRLLSTMSVLGKQGLLTIPVLDEYSRLVTKLLEQALPEQHFSHIYLTHDVDVLDQYRHPRGLVGGILRGEGRAAWRALSGLEHDPAYTFPWFIEQDKLVSGAESLYFIKATRGEGFDYPQYNLHGGDATQLLHLLDQADATLGLHTSYYCTENLLYAVAEKGKLEQALRDAHIDILGKQGDHGAITYNRFHWLRTRGPEDFEALCDFGFTDDFSMGFADHVGFRLGTTRPARWINPDTLQLSDLTMHPLCIMDCTLSNSNYMNIQDESEAYYTCQQVIDKVRQHGGELTLLWHNSNLGPNTYHKQLYQDIIQYLHEA